VSRPIEDALVPAAPAISNKEVAKGAGLAALSRLGALIEVVAQPAYSWMFGLTGYGVYVVLWAAINILANILDLAMGQALQRIVPAEGDRTREHGAVRFALLTGTGLGVAAALTMTLSADWLAGFVARPKMRRGYLPPSRFLPGVYRSGSSSRLLQRRRGQSGPLAPKSACAFSGSRSRGWSLRRASSLSVLTLRACCSVICCRSL
jgi:hypothetical protein